MKVADDINDALLDCAKLCMLKFPNEAYVGLVHYTAVTFVRVLMNAKLHSPWLDLKGISKLIKSHPSFSPHLYQLQSLANFYNLDVDFSPFKEIGDFYCVPLKSSDFFQYVPHILFSATPRTIESAVESIEILYENKKPVKIRFLCPFPLINSGLFRISYFRALINSFYALKDLYTLSLSSFQPENLELKQGCKRIEDLQSNTQYFELESCLEDKISYQFILKILAHTLDFLKDDSLEIESENPHLIRIHLQNNRFVSQSFTFSFPIHFKNCTVSLSRKAATISLKAPKSVYLIESGPVRYVLLQNPLAFPNYNIHSGGNGNPLSGLQYSQKERALKESGIPESQIPPLQNFKESIHLILSTNELVYNLAIRDSKPEIAAILIKHSTLHSEATGGLFMDLSICFLTPECLPDVPKFCFKISKGKERTISMTSKEYYLVCVPIFKYWTRKCCQKETHSIIDKSVAKYFNRSYLEPLYLTIDENSKLMKNVGVEDMLEKEDSEELKKMEDLFRSFQKLPFSQPSMDMLSSLFEKEKKKEPAFPSSSSTQSYCAVCKKSDAKKCLGCGNIEYCGRECQKRDWPTHKKFCKKS